MADSSDDVEKLVVFEKNITNFFTICGNLKRLVESKRVVNSKNLIYDAFDNFVEVYGKIGAEKSLPIFEELYAQKRVSILAGNDGWLKNNCNIEYPRTKKSSKRRYCIMASVYYRNANELSIQAQKEIEEFNDDKNAENVFLPEEFTYPLLEIFLLIAPASDIQKLTLYRDSIKNELKDTEYVANTANVLNMGNLGILLTSALGGLNLQDMAKSMGNVENGGDMSGMGDMSNIGETISNILTNPNTKNVINKVVDSFKDMKNLGDIQEKIGGLLADKELQQSFKDLMPAPDPISDREINSMLADAKEHHPDSNDDIIVLDN